MLVALVAEQVQIAAVIVLKRLFVFLLSSQQNRAALKLKFFIKLSSA